MHVTLLLVCICLCFTLCTSQDDAFNIMKERVEATWTKVPSSQAMIIYAEAKEYVSTIRPDGTWPDINYEDKNPVYWATAEHMNRTLILVLAWRTPLQPFFNQSTLLFPPINNALDFWVAHDFINPNWWWNQISLPLTVGELHVLYYPHESSTQKAGLAKILDRALTQGWTAANLVWQASVNVYHGLAEGNVTHAQTSLFAIWQAIEVKPGIDEGIKIDGVFFQHGEQLYDAGYGADFSSMVLNMIYWTLNTTWAIPAAPLSVFSDYMMNGQQWMAQRDALWDYCVIGRGVSRPSDPGYRLSQHILFPYDELASMPGPRHNEFVQYARRLEGLVPPLYGNRHFWTGDYMVHQRTTYMTSIRMHSKRTFNSECVNEEGKMSLHLGDGVNYVYVSGQEYTGVFPLWDWDRVPGITSAPGVVPLTCQTTKTLGTTTFVGGASDGEFGVAAYDFAAPLNTKLVAKKSWSMFESEYVALGSGITSGYDNVPIITSVTQSNLQSNIYTSLSSNPLTVGTSYLFPPAKNLTWIHHADIGYVFLKQSEFNYTVNVTTNARTGNWFSIGASNMTAEGMVFSLEIQHGTNSVQNARYGYIVVPAVDYATFQKYVDALLRNVTVASATPSGHAVLRVSVVRGDGATDDVMSATFFEEGVVSAGKGYTLTASEPCVVLMRVNNNEKKVLLTVSDPTQTLSQVQLLLDRTLSGSEACTANNSNPKGGLAFSLPTAEHAGQSVMLECSFQ